jgi:tetratricopeptide (TPR) repeat protein
MLFHNKKVEGLDLVSRPGTSGQKPSSIARLDTAAGSGMNSPRSFALMAATACALALFCGLTLQLPALGAQAAPENPELAADLQRGQAALKANDQARAMEEFRAAVQLDPHNIEAHANLGVIAFFHGDCSAAERELHSALEGAQQLVKAQALIGICEKRMGSPSARADPEHAFAVLDDPKLRTQVEVELADIYDQNGGLDHTLLVVLSKNAIERNRKALAADPRLPGMGFELAEAILESSQDANARAEAQIELEASVKAEGDNDNVECTLGKIALLQNKSDEAYAHYRNAHQMNPNDVEAKLGLARILADQGKPQEAMQYLRAAVQIEPLNGPAHYRLSRVCQTLHLNEEVQEEIFLYPDIRQAQDCVAELNRQMNRKPEAQGNLPSEEKQ